MTRCCHPFEGPKFTHPAQQEPVEERAPSRKNVGSTASRSGTRQPSLFPRRVARPHSSLRRLVLRTAKAQPRPSLQPARTVAEPINLPVRPFTHYDAVVTRKRARGQGDRRPFDRSHCRRIVAHRTRAPALRPAGCVPRPFRQDRSSPLLNATDSRQLTRHISLRAFAPLLASPWLLGPGCWALVAGWRPAARREPDRRPTSGRRSRASDHPRI